MWAHTFVLSARPFLSFYFGWCGFYVYIVPFFSAYISLPVSVPLWAPGICRGPHEQVPVSSHLQWGSAGRIGRETLGKSEVWFPVTRSHLTQLLSLDCPALEPLELQHKYAPVFVTEYLRPKHFVVATHKGLVKTYICKQVSGVIVRVYVM